MNTVVVDPSVRQHLGGLAESLEFCDEAGRVLGYFAPVVGQNRSMYDGLQVPVTAEEVQQLKQQPRGRTLSEIWADLESRS